MDLTSALSGDLRLSATGPASPDEVWYRYTRPALWPTWSPHLREVDYPDAVMHPGHDRPGHRGGRRRRGVPHRRGRPQVRTWSWSVRSGPLRVSLRPRRRPGGPASGSVAGSTAWLVTHALWPVAVGYAPLARLALDRLVTPA